MRLRRALRSRLALCLAAVALLAACSGGEGDEAAEESEGPTVPATAPGEVAFAGNDDLEWVEETKTTELDSGTLDLAIVCGEGVAHNVVFEGVQDDEILAECESGESGSGEVELEAGQYTFYCEIAGHRSAGMEGVITVE